MKLIHTALMALALAAFSTPGFAAAEIGKPAPAFTATDTNGAAQTLAQYKGKIVVLEWTNPQCPYVKKQYGTHNMQDLQKAATAAGAVWLSVNSSAAGKEGNLTPEQANQLLKDEGAAPTAEILDAKGEIGHLYEAKTTPHMFVIDKDGVLAYAGAIDDAPSADPATVPNAKNYVKAALDDLAAGRPVATPLTNSYGCGVKYAD
jgi:peroxiredoxin